MEMVLLREGGCIWHLVVTYALAHTLSPPFSNHTIMAYRSLDMSQRTKRGRPTENLLGSPLAFVSASASILPSPSYSVSGRYIPVPLRKGVESDLEDIVTMVCSHLKLQSLSRHQPVFLKPHDHEQLLTQLTTSTVFPLYAAVSANIAAAPFPISRLEQYLISQLVSLLAVWLAIINIIFIQFTDVFVLA